MKNISGALVVFCLVAGPILAIGVQEGEALPVETSTKAASVEAASTEAASTEEALFQDFPLPQVVPMTRDLPPQQYRLGPGCVWFSWDPGHLDTYLGRVIIYLGWECDCWRSYSGAEFYDATSCTPPSPP